MRFDFELLEGRELLAAKVMPMILDGPTVAFQGEQVTYVVEVKNRGDRPGSAQINGSHSLKEAQWMSGGMLSSTPPNITELGPQESKIFLLTGRIADSAELSMRLSVCVRRCDDFSTVVLNHPMDSSNVGAALAGELAGFQIEFLESFHRAEPAGDANDDGIGDLYVFRVDAHTLPSAGTPSMNKIVLLSF